MYTIYLFSFISQWMQILKFEFRVARTSCMNGYIEHNHPILPSSLPYVLYIIVNDFFPSFPTHKGFY